MNHIFHCSTITVKIEIYDTFNWGKWIFDDCFMRLCNLNWYNSWHCFIQMRVFLLYFCWLIWSNRSWNFLMNLFVKCFFGIVEFWVTLWNGGLFWWLKTNQLILTYFTQAFFQGKILGHKNIFEISKYGQFRCAIVHNKNTE